MIDHLFYIGLHSVLFSDFLLSSFSIRLLLSKTAAAATAAPMIVRLLALVQK
jgi:hypothetical protein